MLHAPHPCARQNTDARRSSRLSACFRTPLQAPKKPRINWSQELHTRFLNAMFQLGLKNAVPKTILQLMNVEGLTRENVASHLQKYRILLKRHAQLPANAPLNPENLRKLEVVQQVG